MISSEQKISLKSNFVLLIFCFITFFSISFLVKLPADIYKICFLILIFCFLFLFLNFLKLKVIIEENNIIYQMFPFSKNILLFQDIQKIEFMNENPYSRYWGLGIRWRGKELAYFLQKEKMLCVYLKNGKKIVLGINNIFNEEEVLKMIKI